MYGTRTSTTVGEYDGTSTVFVGFICPMHEYVSAVLYAFALVLLVLYLYLYSSTVP